MAFCPLVAYRLLYKRQRQTAAGREPGAAADADRHSPSIGITLMKDDETTAKPMLSLKDAAAFLGYQGDDALREIVDRSRAKARGAATKGPTIKFFQPTKKSPIKFKREWLLEFIDEHTIDPTRAAAAEPKRAKKKATTVASDEFRHWLN